MLGVVQFAAQCTKEPKTGQVLVRFYLRFLTRHIAKKPDCPVKNRTPGNPSSHSPTIVNMALSCIVCEI